MSSPTETSPLLAIPAQAIAEEGVVPQQESNDPTVSRTANLLRSIKTLQILFFTSSIIDFTFAIATYAVFNTNPFSREIEMETFLIGTFVAALFSGAFLRWNFPYLFNLLVNLGIPFYFFAYCNQILINWPEQYWCPDIDTNPPHRDTSSRTECIKQLRVFQGLLCVCMGFTAIIMICNFALAILRTVVLLRQRAAPGSSQLSLWLPTGEVTLSVTIKVLKQQSGTESSAGRAAVTVEHGTLPQPEQTRGS